MKVQNFSNKTMKRLLELLISDVIGCWEDEGVSFGISDKEGEELIQLLKELKEDEITTETKRLIETYLK